MATAADDVRQILNTVLQLGPRVGALGEASPLLGAVPELDSMAVVAVITSLEEHFGFMVDDDEISAETFETFGSLVDFVQLKLNE